MTEGLKMRLKRFDKYETYTLTTPLHKDKTESPSSRDVNMDRIINRFFSASIFTLFLGLSGCAIPGSFLPGQIYSMETGKNLDFEIEVSYGKGDVRAKDKSSGEEFTGTYVAVSGGSVTIGTSFGSVGGTSATTYSGGAMSQTQIGSSKVKTTSINRSMSVMASTSALLFGNQGTVLDCGIMIERGHRPKGIGTCVDREGVFYKLMF